MTKVKIQDSGGEKESKPETQNPSFGRLIEQKSEAEENANQEFVRLKLQQAEQELETTKKKVEVGPAPSVDYEKAKIARDIAAAEVKGDNVEAAQLKLAIAELDLYVASKKLSAGKATTREAKSNPVQAGAAGNHEPCMNRLKCHNSRTDPFRPFHRAVNVYDCSLSVTRPAHIAPGLGQQRDGRGRELRASASRDRAKIPAPAAPDRHGHVARFHPPGPAW